MPFNLDLRKSAASDFQGPLDHRSRKDCMWQPPVNCLNQSETHPSLRALAGVRTAKLKAALGTVFVGIAMDNPNKDFERGSDDLMVYMDAWSDEELAELKRKRIELGLWNGKGELWCLRQDEFPAADQRIALR